jgi:hypothetical protein
MAKRHSRKGLKQLESLLIQRATERLDDATASELRQLLEAFPETDASAFDRAAAAVWLAATPVEETMPAELRESILRRAQSGETT